MLKDGRHRNIAFRVIKILSRSIGEIVTGLCLKENLNKISHQISSFSINLCQYNQRYVFGG